MVTDPTVPSRSASLPAIAGNEKGFAELWTLILPRDFGAQVYNNELHGL